MSLIIVGILGALLVILAYRILYSSPFLPSWLEHRKSTEFRWNPQAKPTTGGLLWMVAFVMGWFYETLSGTLASDSLAFSWFLLLAVGLFSFWIGFWDDLYGTHFALKLMFQSMLAVFVIGWMMWQFPWLPPGIGIATGIWWIGMMNAWNFIDNMNGVLVFQVWVHLWIWQIWFSVFPEGFWFLMLTATILIALANYPWGFRFAGDKGSLLMGSLAGWVILQIALTSAENFPHPERTLLLLLILLSGTYPGMDLLYVVLRRIREGRPPWEGGKDHTSHEMVRKRWFREPAVPVVTALYSLLYGSGVAIWWMEWREELVSDSLRGWIAGMGIPGVAILLMVLILFAGQRKSGFSIRL